MTSQEKKNDERDKKKKKQLRKDIIRSEGEGFGVMNIEAEENKDGKKK